MRTHELIEKATLGPTALRAIYQAFDEGWAEIAANYSDDAQVEAARTKLAQALLSVANYDSSDSKTLKEMALAMMGER